VLLLNPRWKVNLARVKMMVSLRRGASGFSYSSDKTLAAPSSEASIALAAMQRKVSHDSPSAGSLFLRLGCVGMNYFSKQSESRYNSPEIQSSE